jgi:predicted ArsR family transcriptional regulator
MPEPVVTVGPPTRSTEHALRGRRTSPVEARPDPTGVPGSVLRRAIVRQLRRAGPSAPDDLARAIGASRSGIVGQLRALEAAGLVMHRAERHGVGRPRHVFDVTPEAQELFPADYDGLAVGLVEAIVDVGGDELLEAIFAARRRQLGIIVRERVDGIARDMSLTARTHALARLQDEQGYLAEVVVGDDGALRLVERNCAIHHVAALGSAACDAELALFREVLGTEVTREAHMPSGDRCCSYRIGALPS